MGVVQELIDATCRPQHNFNAKQIAGIIASKGIKSYGNLAAEIQAVKANPAYPNSMRMLGMLAARAGLVTDELMRQPFYAFGAQNFIVGGQHEFGRDAFDYASDCRAEGEFGDHAFSHSQGCTAGGKFSDSYFPNATGFRVDGKFEKRHGFIAAKKGMISGNFEIGDNWPVYTGENTALFSEKIGRFLPGEGSIVIFKEGDLGNRGMPRDMIVLGIGYTGGDKRIIPIAAEYVPNNMNALNADFPDMVNAILARYASSAPSWLGEYAHR